jgi:hypothetical protein
LLFEILLQLAPFLAPVGVSGLSEALDINDRGDIVGTAYDAQGWQHAFLFVVPERSSAALLVLAGVHESPGGVSRM